MAARVVYLIWAGLICVRLAGASSIDFDQVRNQARAVAQQPFRERISHVPEALLKLGYVQYQAIQFRRNKALWAKEGLPFQLEFFLPGSVHKETVVLYEADGSTTRRIPFSSESFSLDPKQVALPPNLEYAGFRVLSPRDNFGEVASFLGASYFRMIGCGQVFGASARGLALNTSLREKEEFPAYREFWIRKPEQGDQTLTFWSLLDSPSVAAAFEFILAPGSPTITRVQAAFFPRRAVKESGIAPVTTMFYYDENSRPPFTDYRSAVHDSDGLLMETGHGEVLWRDLRARLQHRGRPTTKTWVYTWQP